MKIAYLENYDLELGRLITSGVDVWLNTPEPPLEASGTSGMKAALNGVPSFSVLDGWWVEGHIEGITGWSLGKMGSEAAKVKTAKRTLLPCTKNWRILSCPFSIETAIASLK